MLSPNPNHRGLHKSVTFMSASAGSPDPTAGPPITRPSPGGTGLFSLESLHFGGESGRDSPTLPLLKGMRESRSSSRLMLRQCESSSLELAGGASESTLGSGGAFGRSTSGMLGSIPGSERGGGPGGRTLAADCGMGRGAAAAAGSGAGLGRGGGGGGDSPLQALEGAGSRFGRGLARLFKGGGGGEDGGGDRSSPMGDLVRRGESWSSGNPPAFDHSLGGCPSPSPLSGGMLTIHEGGGTTRGAPRLQVRGSPGVAGSGAMDR